MSERDEIPSEVRERAAEIGTSMRFELADIARHEATSLWARDGVIERMNKAIARAIMEERERCAKIAESLGTYPELNNFAGGPEWYKHGKSIAAAIRSGKSEQGGER